MKKSTLITLFTAALLFFGTCQVGWGQTVFTESIGTVTGTTTIAVHETANGFDNDGYTMNQGGAAMPADIRATSVSSGYTGASGLANVYFTSTANSYGFAIEGIDASLYTSLKVQFGYRKESATVLPTLVLDYWDGSAYVNVPFTFNEAANAVVAWYVSPIISLPAGAQISTLKLRWVKSGTASVRIDDIKLTGITSTPSISLSTALFSGFTYVEGVGPSSSQTYNLSGTNLSPASGNVSVTGSSNYEVSTNNSTFSGSVNIPYTSSALASTPVYIRLKSGLPSSNYFNESVANAGGGATTQNVTCNGNVTSNCPAETFPLYENFTTSVGSYLTNNCWISHSVGVNPVSVSASTITYPGYLPSGQGNEVTLATSGEDVNKAFTPQTSGVVYASFLVNVTSAQNSTDNGDYFAHFGSASGLAAGSFGGRIWIKKDPASAAFAFGLSKSSTLANLSYTGYNYNTGTTYLIVVKYSIISGVSNDIADLFINPTLNSNEPVPTISTLAADNLTSDPSQLASFCLRQGSASTAPALKLDGIVVSNNWADIVGVSASPNLSVDPVTLSGFSYVSGSGPSASQSYSLSGANLTGFPGVITVAGSTNYEVSTDNVSFAASKTLAFTSATLSSTLIYIRLKSGLNAGTYNENIGSTGGGVSTPVNVACTGSVFALEPTNQPTGFTAASPSYSSMTVSWADNDGAQPATGFLILANTTGIFTPPVDGTPPVIDGVLIDGSSAVTVLHGVQTYTWYSLNSSTSYYFAIYPYTNSGTSIDYKITVPATTNATTLVYVAPVAAWTFDATAASPSTPTSVAANDGIQSATAMLYADGTNGSSTWLQATELNAFAGTTINDPREGLAIFDGFSYCPLSGGTGLTANGKSIVLKFSMIGLENPVLTYSTRYSGSTGFNSQLWAYSTDGINFTDFGTNLAPTSTSFTTKTLDLSSVNAIDQASVVYLKITFAGATGATSNNRLDNIVINASSANKNLNLKVYLEGLYAGAGLMNQAHGVSGAQYGAGIADQVTVELHDASAPYATAYTYGNTNLNTNGTLAITTIPGSLSGLYYVVIKHRNSIETWSAAPVSFTGSGPVTYDFSTSAAQAYGSNQKLMGTAYVIFGGDLSQDGSVDATDMAAVDNASTAFLTGYLAADVNGDGSVDASDMAMIDNSSTAFISLKKP